MIVAFSTSSPLASVALISSDGEVLASSEEMAPRGASGASLKLLLALLASLKLDLSAAELFVSDLGPGSFTGVKVGVTIAKTLAFAHGKQTAGADCFDLVDPTGTVVVPSKRGEYFIRRLGETPIRSENLPHEPCSGYGPAIEPPNYPRADRFAVLLPRLEHVIPEALVPAYLIEPSISTPKQPFAGSS